MILKCMINQGMLRFFKVADLDGDDVRCRLASGTDECSSICDYGSVILSVREVSFFC